MKKHAKKASATSSAPSRILIHASNSDAEGGQHPSWRGESDLEITTVAFNAEDGVDMSGINAQLERLLDKAPSDSTANLLLKKTKGGYKAFFRIRSAQNRFKGFISGRRLVDVVERVMRDVKSQIDQWKETRRLSDEFV